MILHRTTAYVVKVNQEQVLVAAANVQEAIDLACKWYMTEYVNYEKDRYGSADRLVVGLPQIDSVVPLDDYTVQSPILTGIYLTVEQIAHPFERREDNAALRAVNDLIYAEAKRKQATKREAKELRDSVKKPKKAKGKKRGAKRSPEAIAKYKATMAAKKANAAIAPLVEAAAEAVALNEPDQTP